MLALLAAAALLASGAPAPPPQEAPPNAFAGVETHYLSNGLKVWYRRLPNEPVVSVSVALPFGADTDPVGKEQLAHFTEHMLFADQPGKTEEEIRREIEERGGTYNASVTPDRAFYYVRIGREHAAFAIEWLSRILAPHAMDPEVVDRQREPVALEVGARPRQFFDWIWAYYLSPPFLRTPGFWEREFGIETRAARDYYPYESLNRITPEDLRRYYDTYYVPSLMTVTVVGDVERQEALERIDATFGALPARPEPADPVTPVDPGRYWQRIMWMYRSNVAYTDRYKFYRLTADDEVKLIFVARLLQKRLNDRLRFGERKATYGIGVGIVKRGGAGYLRIGGGIRAAEFTFARGVVNDELDGLRSGTLGIDEFEASRSAVTNQLQVTNTSPEDLEGWVSRFFYDTRVHSDLPDLVAAFRSLTLADVQAFLAQALVNDRRVVSAVYPHPINQGLLVLIIGVLVGATWHLISRWLLQPIDMPKLRYVARFRVPRPYFAAAALLLVLVFAVAARLLFYGYQVLTDGFLVRIDSFAIQWSAYALMLVVTVALLLLALARVPRKILAFEDSIRIKYLSYRSVLIRDADIEELSRLRFRDVWLTQRIWRCTPLALGLLAPAIYLRRSDGKAFFFRARDTEELFQLLRRRSGAPPSSGDNLSSPGQHRPG